MDVPAAFMQVKVTKKTTKGISYLYLLPVKKLNYITALQRNWEKPIDENILLLLLLVVI